MSGEEHPVTNASSNRKIGDLNLFSTDDPVLWEEKYQKKTRKFSRVITGNPIPKK